MIEVRDLTKNYGPHRAIDNLNFTVKKGEVVGFLGPNGAGKSTTMKIITGYMAPSSGMVKVGGFDVFENPIEVKEKIGYLPEIPPVYFDMYVRDYLTFVANLKKVERSKIKASVDRALDKTNLGGVANRLIQNLSKGFKQRVGIAQALVSDPEVLILDEPTVGLDPRQVAEIRQLIKELAGQHTIVLSTHVLPEVQATCQRIIIINKGKIIAEDTIAGLTQKMGGTSRVQVRVRRNFEKLQKSLMGVTGVEQVSPSDETGILQVSVKNNEDVFEKIATHIVNEGAGLVQMQPMIVTLEDIFIKLTSDTTKGAAL